ncbi:MAG: hypothetical protein WHV61_04800, partial [Burkholderiales bacterium]
PLPLLLPPRHAERAPHGDQQTRRRGEPPRQPPRLARLHGRPGAPDLVHLHEDPHYAAAVHAVGSIGGETPELPLAPGSDPCAQR